MPRLLATSGAALAVLAGLAFAPYSHVHSVGTTTVHHSRGDLGAASVKHAHFSPHDSHHADPLESHGEDSDDDHSEDGATRQISPANDFLFPPVDTFQDPAPAVLVRPVDLVPDITASETIQIQLPPAHGPPVRAHGPARAPPTIPPAAV